MALHYFIDGYNLIHSHFALAKGPLQMRRERLLGWMESQRPHGSARNRATVVFDGRPGRSWTGWRGEVQVVFSDERDADSVIKDRIDALSNPRVAVVVTDDRAIQRWVRGAGALVMSCREFLSERATPRAEPAEAPGADDIQRINDEFRRLWK